MTAIRYLYCSCILVACLSLTACAGGASIKQDDSPGQYQVTVPFEQLAFGDGVQGQAFPGITGTAQFVGITPELWVRFNVTSQVNGSYAGMPYPPTLYTVRRLPYYKTDADPVTVRIVLQNTSDKVITAAQAVCSFDVNGKTVSTTPLGATDLLPGHSVSLTVKGPLIDQFEAQGSGKFTVWVYGLGDDKSQLLRWDVPYTLTQENRTVMGSMMQTKSGDEAKLYQDRDEPARPEDAPSATTASGPR